MLIALWNYLLCTTTIYIYIYIYIDIYIYLPFWYPKVQFMYKVSMLKLHFILLWKLKMYVYDIHDAQLRLQIVQ